MARDDPQLLRDLRAGRRDACAELIHHHYQRVYRFLVHLTRDEHQAEDLTQETFAAAWEKIATFVGHASLGTWLHRIAYTKFIDAQRRRRRTTDLLQRLEIPGVSPADPLATLAAADEVRHLYRALHELVPDDRTVLVLHYLQGLSYREMATVLAEPAGTVKWRTSEALNHLRALLDEEVADHVL
jgi:RNA polymerase sigma-70 factor (ECF subfamily)